MIVGIIEAVLAGIETSPEQYERRRELAVAGLEQASGESPAREEWY